MADWSVLTFAFLAAFLITYIDAQCGQTTFTATTIPTIITSPNYPQHYDKNSQCTYVITTSEPNHVIHVEGLDVQLAMDLTDKLEFFNGATTINAILTVFGADEINMQSNQNTLSIKFSSNGIRQFMGFRLKFWSGPIHSAVCQPNNQITVGRNPVNLNLPHALTFSGNSDCLYVFKTAASADMIILKISSWDFPEGLGCAYGSIQVYDGEGVNGKEIINSCLSDRPFYFIDGSNGVITLRIKSTYVGTDRTQFKVKVVSISSQVDSCSDVMEIPIKGESYIWYPNMRDVTGAFCSKDLTVSTQDTVRVIVADTNVCATALTFDVQDAGITVARTCVNNMPAFKSSMASLKLVPTNGQQRHLLKISGFKRPCNGKHVETLLANTMKVKTIEHENIQAGSNCQYRINSDADHVVYATFMSTLSGGDCVRVYEGTTKINVLLNKCGPFKMQIKSTMRELRYELNTNIDNRSGEVSVMYHSALAVKSCGAQQNILVKREKINGTTPNYPLEYPLNEMCTWQFVSYRPDYVVVIEIIESDLPEDCTDVASVIDGEDLVLSPKIGEWCGSRMHQYRGTSQVLTMIFKATGMSLTGHTGFKFRYYADTPIARGIDPGTNVVLIASILSIIVLAGGFFFVVYRLCVKRNKKRKEDREPLN